MNLFPTGCLPSLRLALAQWYQANQRPLPWRQTRDPYKIWISEIMLQQTRVAAVIPYYERFLALYPTVDALAVAEAPQLLAAWAGLGYYSRARNLQAAARQIVAAGGFPLDYNEIRALPGIGPYTAAAVASIAFGQPYAAVDGNVLRVLARLTADSGDIGKSATRARLAEMAQTVLQVGNPSQHNQAMMELGATVCLPRSPNCSSCPVEKYCLARKSSLERELPIKLSQVKTHRARRTLLVVIRNGNILLWQRGQDASLLAGFWELPEPDQLPAAQPVPPRHHFKHSITNHIYDFQVCLVAVARARRPCQWVPLRQLTALPLSTVARKALAPLVNSGNFCAEQPFNLK